MSLNGMRCFMCTNARESKHVIELLCRRSHSTRQAPCKGWLKTKQLCIGMLCGRRPQTSVQDQEIIKAFWISAPVIWQLVFQGVHWQAKPSKPFVRFSKSAYATHQCLAQKSVAFIDPKAADYPVLSARTCRGPYGCIWCQIIGIVMLKTCWRFPCASSPPSAKNCCRHTVALIVTVSLLKTRCAGHAVIAA